MVHDFESQLDDEHEIAVKLASFGTSILLYITDIGYYNTDLICFYGYVNGHYSQLVQHVSQINFLLTSVDKPAEAQHARRIGFEAPQDE
ncbi:MAG: DUF6173 family protein [Clostridia bacterium]|nr:DUF6173 family protein [Clostridia bacterium]